MMFGMEDEAKKLGAELQAGNSVRSVSQLPTATEALRDQFAMAALTGLLTNERACSELDDRAVSFKIELAEFSYEIVDAMLKARQEGK